MALADLEEMMHDGVVSPQLVQLTTVLVPVLLVDRHVLSSLKYWR